MHTVTTLRPLNIAPGSILGLTEKQAKPRLSNLERDGNRYLVLRTVQFKAGETFGIDSVDKAQADAFKVIREPEPQAVKPVAKPAARRTAKNT